MRVKIKIGKSDQMTIIIGYIGIKMSRSSPPTNRTMDLRIMPTTLIIKFCSKVSKKTEILLASLYDPDILFHGKKYSFNKDLIAKYSNRKTKTFLYITEI